MNSIIKKFSHFACCEMKQKQMLIFLVGCIVTFILELLAYLFKGAFSIVASRLWMLSVVAFVIFFLFVVIKQLHEDVREKKLLLPFIFFVIICFFVFQIGNYGFSDMSYESTQEVLAGLRAFEQPDWNYTGKGFTNYPVKQYIINAVPTLVFGRKFFSLNLGFALPFLAGLTLLFVELRKFSIRLGIDENYGIFPIFVIAFCPFIDEFYYIFEQAITPVSYTMIILALFLRLLRTRSLMTVSMLTITACMLPFMYTPALAFMGLFTVMMIYHAATVIRKKSEFVKPGKKNLSYLVSVFVSAVTPVLFFICTLVGKREDRFLTSYGETFLPEKRSEYLKAFMSFFINSDSLFWGFFGAVVLIYLIAALTYRLKIHDLLIALWSIATALFSFMLPGVALVFNFYYKPNVLAQRSIILVPVIAVSVLYAVAGFIKKHAITIRKDFLAIVATAFMLFGVNSLFQQHKAFEYNNHIQNMKYIIKYCEEVTEYHGNNYDDHFILVVHTDNGLFANTWEWTEYFFPNAKLYLFPTEQYGGISIYDTIFPRYVFSENPNTAGYYYLDFNSRTFRNNRFDQDATLYFKYIEPDYSYVNMYDKDYIETYNLQPYLQEQTDN